MRIDKQLFRSGSFLVMAHAAGLILLLFGLYFTVFHPPAAFTGAPFFTLLFHTTGGWLLLGGLTLFLISLAGLWNTEGLRKSGSRAAGKNRFPSL
ncbi:hypothetical protein C8P63_11397 [Melghirimyces profundicolus]|uniref:Uncharacterized protein n=1 Tax=Melghirimyces profundicolus TaxID=1242148 RepID=A0A2T6BSV6_9BACL|nr:hypothetical protein [Melghirimyces profundicolus]PTX59152.1 hypothetical protein C8P63_11397 [Melghirimyces profundicolus]